MIVAVYQLVYPSTFMSVILLNAVALVSDYGCYR